jgi:flagellar basal-body rod protein FlgC
MNIDANVSAMSALGSAHQVTANNIANVNTDGFQASRANLETGPGGEGVRVSSLTKDTSSGSIFQGRETSNVDTAREMVGLMTTENAYAANAAVIRADDQTTGYLLDMLV